MVWQKEEGSSATDSVTDVTDGLKLEEGSSATDSVTDVTDGLKLEEGRSHLPSPPCRNYPFHAETRSPLAPLKKGGTRVFVKSPKTSGEVCS